RRSGAAVLAHRKRTQTRDASRPKSRGARAALQGLGKVPPARRKTAGVAISQVPSVPTGPSRGNRVRTDKYFRINGVPTVPGVPSRFPYNPCLYTSVSLHIHAHFTRNTRNTRNTQDLKGVILFPVVPSKAEDWEHQARHCSGCFDLS